MPEHWNLYLDVDYPATPWPWPGHDFATLDASELATLPGAIDDFTRYSPTDGACDMVHVPRAMPRELPRCHSRLAVYHDAANLYVLIEAVRPAAPIPELVDLTREDFSCVIPWPGGTRGLYFGLNQDGEAIGCVQVWDPDVQPVGVTDEWPFVLLRRNPGAGPSASAAGILREGYAARCVATGNGWIGAFRIEKRLLAGAFQASALPLSVGRRCYATSELVGWGSPIIWGPRPDRHGAVRLVPAPETPCLPRLYRLDAVYDATREEADLAATWHGPVTPEALPVLDRGTYAGFASKVTFALNGHEQTLGLAPSTTVRFAVPDGWNRLEVLTACAPPLELSFQKLSGNRLHMARPRAAGGLPSLDELNAAFRAWHRAHEESYLGDGTWGGRAAPVHCLCHDGIFHAEPYLYASRHFERDGVYEERVREMCARALRCQRPAGWFPCHCASNSSPGREPELGEGGAFTNGSVGEGLALAGTQFGEDAWLSASRRAADYGWYTWEDNQNYAAFTLWHLAALYEAAPEEQWLRTAVYQARNCVLRDIGLSGAQDGHNYFSAYGNITLKGMARLLQVLPPEHAFRAELQEKVIRFTNQMLARQQASGLFAGRNRKYLGFHHLVPGLFFVAAALPALAPQLEPALAGMVQALLRTPQPERDRSPDAGLTLALMGRYLQMRALAPT